MVFTDGPRNNRDESLVRQVRELLAESAWREYFAEFEVVAASHNKGLAGSIVGGVSAMMSIHPSLIVLEDDILVAHDFLVFMNACLSFFREDQFVGSVTGYCPLAKVPAGYREDIMAVPRICSHGWGTWSDRWASVDWQAADASRVWSEPHLRKRMNSAGSDQLHRLRRQLDGRIKTWAILFQLWLTLTGRVTIYPVRNRVKNIGFDGSGTHTRPSDKMHSRIEEDHTATCIRTVKPSHEIIAAFHRAYSGSIAGRIKRAIINLRPPSRCAADSALHSVDQDASDIGYQQPRED